jgi:O-acetylserine/cysteine efflux transporter
VVQKAGITRTSVTHAALLIGAVPVMVAVIAALWRRTVARAVAWAGFALSLAGVGLITGGPGGGATVIGDGLVLASLMVSAVFTVAQGSLLSGRDPVAVTAVQFLGAALAVLPFSAITEGVPAVPHAPGAVLAVVALAAGGTVLPFTLFAFGQSRVSAEVAGAFYNIEPLVGAVAGIVLFGDPAGLAQAVGGAAIIAGIALSSLPLLAGGARTGDAAAAVSQARPGRSSGPGVTRSWPGCQTAARRATAGPRARSRPPHRRGVAARRPGGSPGRRWLPRVPAAGMPRRRVMAGRARGARGRRQAGRRRHSLASSP